LHFEENRTNCAEMLLLQNRIARKSSGGLGMILTLSVKHLFVSY